MAENISDERDVDEAPDAIDVADAAEAGIDVSARGPGGAGVDDAGEINTARFSEGPSVSAEVTWWNRRVSWAVRREPTDHQVVVAETVEPRWGVHIATAVAAALLFTIGAVLFGGLSVVWSMVLLIVSLTIVASAVLWEQRMSPARRIERIMVCDSVIWDAVCERIAEVESRTLSAQKKRFADAEQVAKTAHKAAVKEAKAAGVAAPDYEGPDKDDYIDTETALGPDDVYRDISALLADEAQDKYHGDLGAALLANPTEALEAGRGVSGCTCAACGVNAELGQLPAVSGVVVGARRKQARAALADGDAAAAVRARARAKEEAAEALRVAREKKEREAQKRIDKARKQAAAEVLRARKEEMSRQDKGLLGRFRRG